MKKLKEEFHSQYDLNDDLAQIKAILAETAYDVKGRAGEILNETYEEAKEKAVNFKDEIGNYTGERPFKTIAISFAVGLLAGYLIHRN